MDATHTEADSPNLIWRLDRADLMSEEATYPAPVRWDPLGYFSTLERAENALRQDVTDSSESGEDNGTSVQAVRYDLVAIELDSGRRAYRIRRYAGDGTFRYEVHQGVEKPWPDFVGVRAEECSFQVGDIVELVRNDELVLGIVVAQPPTPEYVAQHPRLFEDGAEDVYFVFFEEEWDHDHPDDGELMRPRFPVPTEAAERLRHHFSLYPRS